MNAYYREAERRGIAIVYDMEVRDLIVRDSRFISAVAVHHGTSREIAAKAVVVAAGGFESNVGWLREAWGVVADNFLVRGTP